MKNVSTVGRTLWEGFINRVLKLHTDDTVHTRTSISWKEYRQFLELLSCQRADLHLCISFSSARAEICPKKFISFCFNYGASSFAVGKNYFLKEKNETTPQKTKDSYLSERRLANKQKSKNTVCIDIYIMYTVWSSWKSCIVQSSRILQACQRSLRDAIIAKNLNVFNTLRAKLKTFAGLGFRVDRHDIIKVQCRPQSHTALIVCGFFLFFSFGWKSRVLDLEQV